MPPAQLCVCVCVCHPDFRRSRPVNGFRLARSLKSLCHLRTGPVQSRENAELGHDGQIAASGWENHRHGSSRCPLYLEAERSHGHQLTTLRSQFSHIESQFSISLPPTISF
jgi:hypothetical protein